MPTRPQRPIRPSPSRSATPESWGLFAGADVVSATPPTENIGSLSLSLSLYLNDYTRLQYATTIMLVLYIPTLVRPSFPPLLYNQLLYGDCATVR